MENIISITSNRGGLGKTTTTLNVGVSLAQQGHRVLLIDGDPLNSLSIAANLTEYTDQGILQVVKKQITTEKIIFPANDLPLSMMHLGVENPSDIQYLEGKIRKGALGKIIHKAAKKFDYMLIDTPCGHSILPSLLLAYSDACLMVMSCKSTVVKTLPLFLKQVLRIRSILNPNLRFLGIVITMFDALQPLQSVIMGQTHTEFPSQSFFSTIIPVDRSFETADMQGIPLCRFRRSKDISDAYSRLALEIKMRVNSTTPYQGHDELPEKLF